jgi:uncharacterized SAM-binding protein YcdF (DUF218 family)
VAGVLVGLTGVWAARGWLLPPLAAWLDVGERPQRVDYVMVLPGDANSRPFVAAAWIRAGLADRVLVPVTVSSPDVDDGISLSSDELLRRVLAARGVPKERITVLPGQSDSTWNDAQSLGRFLQSAAPGTRVAVVTSDYHTRRARWSFRRAVPEFRHQIRFVSAPTDRYDPTQWWRCHAGFMAITSEYVKFAIYAAGDPTVLATGAVLLAVLVLAGCVLARRGRAMTNREGRSDRVTQPTSRYVGEDEAAESVE